MNPTYDIAVCGYGPVGKLLAILLGRQGHKIVLVDKFSGGYPLPRGVTHDSEFARILELIGLRPDTIPNITGPYDDFYIWRNAEGEILQDVDWSGIGPSGWNNTWFFNQPSLEEAMNQLVSKLPNVEVRTQTEMVDFADHGDHTSMTVINQHGEKDVITAKYLIGADGANSAVRRKISPVWHDQGYFFDWLVVDVIMGSNKSFPHIANQMCDPRRPATMVPGGPGRRRWEFMKLENETVEELNESGKAWQLLEPFGITAQDATLERHSVYRFQAGWAETWREGRVLIVGDAAHLTPPFAGQGLCAGFRDAMNLYWKLDQVLKGISNEKILDSYGPERKPHVAQFIEFAIELGKIICVLDPAKAKERDDRMLAARANRGDSGAPKPPAPQLGEGVHRGSIGGYVSEQSNWLVDGKLVWRDEHIGQPGALISSKPIELSPDQKQALLERHVGIYQIDAHDQGSQAWLNKLNADVALIRPDFYIFDVSTVDQAGKLVDDYINNAAIFKKD